MQSSEITHDKVKVVFIEDFRDKLGRLIIHSGYGGRVKSHTNTVATIATYRKTCVTNNVPLSILKLDIS